MNTNNLQDFLKSLDAAGELHTIEAPVSYDLEITEITDRVSKSPAPSTSPTAAITDPKHHHLGGKALLFKNVQGAKFPLAINTFGSYRRMEMALNIENGGFEALADKIGKLAKPVPPTTLMDKLKKIPELMSIAKVPPKVVGKGVCQQNVITGDDINLFDLPILKCWPHDGDPSAFGYPQGLQEPGQGRFITFAGIHTVHPETGDRNIGMYRAQLLDKNKTAMHWHVHHDGARHWRAWKKKGQPMPLAIVFGGEACLPYAATAPLPPGISEHLMAGFLHGSGIELVQCKTIDLQVPANAEIVIEGYVSNEAGPIGYDPRKKGPDGEPLPVGPGAVFEGPFGDHTGFYSLPDRYPIFTVTAITYRDNAVYPTTIVGLPPQEDYYMGKATERLFLPLLQTLVHDIIDYDLPMFGVFHNCAFIKIKKEYPLQARRVMHAIWGAGQMAWTKMLIVVDEDVDVHDVDDVMFHMAANCDPTRDLEIVDGPLDILDHAAPYVGAGGKIGFDATAKIPGEQVNGRPIRDWPTKVDTTDAIKAQVTQRWKEFGF